MKKHISAPIIFAAFAAIAGYLISSISWVGRTGINLVYKEYRVLKSGWKVALIMFIVWLTLYFIQAGITRKSSRRTAFATNLVLLLAALAGLLFCYYDFRHTISHRWLGERFHLGVYLFWLVWIRISIRMLATKRPIEISMQESVA